LHKFTETILYQNCHLIQSWHSISSKFKINTEYERHVNRTSTCLMCSLKSLLFCNFHFTASCLIGVTTFLTMQYLLQSSPEYEIIQSEVQTWNYLVKSFSRGLWNVGKQVKRERCIVIVSIVRFYSTCAKNI